MRVEAYMNRGILSSVEAIGVLMRPSPAVLAHLAEIRLFVHERRRIEFNSYYIDPAHQHIFITLSIPCTAFQPSSFSASDASAYTSATSPARRSTISCGIFLFMKCVSKGCLQLRCTTLPATGAFISLNDLQHRETVARTKIVRVTA